MCWHKWTKWFDHMILNDLYNVRYRHTGEYKYRRCIKCRLREFGETKRHYLMRKRSMLSSFGKITIARLDNLHFTSYEYVRTDDT